MVFREWNSQGSVDIKIEQTFRALHSLRIVLLWWDRLRSLATPVSPKDVCSLSAVNSSVRYTMSIENKFNRKVPLHPFGPSDPSRQTSRPPWRNQRDGSGREAVRLFISTTCIHQKLVLVLVQYVSLFVRRRYGRKETSRVIEKKKSYLFSFKKSASRVQVSKENDQI